MSAGCTVLTYNQMREMKVRGAEQQARALVESGTPEAYDRLHRLARHWLRRAQREYDSAWGIVWEDIADIYWVALDTSPGRMS